MSEIVNLKRHRKRLARETKEHEAQANRERFGRSKKDRALSRAEQDRSLRQLDGHKRES
jgi:hypothetical protein